MPAKEQRGLRDAISSGRCVQRRGRSYHFPSTAAGNRRVVVRRKLDQRINPAQVRHTDTCAPFLSKMNAHLLVNTEFPSSCPIRHSAAISRHHHLHWKATASVGTAAGFHSHITEHANQKQAGLCFYVQPEGK